MSGSQKLKKFFIDRKVDREHRKSIPVLTNALGDIIWIIGMRISNLYRITDRTQQVLHLTQYKCGGKWHGWLLMGNFPDWSLCLI